jgi:hypothetical protein
MQWVNVAQIYADLAPAAAPRMQAPERAGPLMTIWDVFWFVFLFIPLCILWVMMLIDLMRRPDLVGWQKGVWAMVLVFFPWIGVFAYLVVRPRDMAFAPATTGSAQAAPMYAPQAPPPAPAPPPATPAQVSSDAPAATA